MMPSSELIKILRTGAQGLDYSVRFLILDACDRLERQIRDNELLMQKIVELRSSNKWIPVTERLPEVSTTHNTRWDKSTDSIRVLCTCVQADGKKMVKEGYCKVYSGGNVYWKIPGTIHSVTHWMPLPEPPKEG